MTWQVPLILVGILVTFSLLLSKHLREWLKGGKVYFDLWFLLISPGLLGTILLRTTSWGLECVEERVARLTSDKKRKEGKVRASKDILQPGPTSCLSPPATVLWIHWVIKPLINSEFSWFNFL
jgi:hypothetical protein